MYLISATAKCEDCNWRTQGKNSMGNAARHSKVTNHYIKLELCYEHVFGVRHIVTDSNNLLQTTLFSDNTSI